jgi:hypothetical protein
MDLKVLQLVISVAMLTMLAMRGVFERSVSDVANLRSGPLKSIYIGLLSGSAALVILSAFQMRASQPEPPKTTPDVTMGYPPSPHSEATFSVILAQEPELKGYGLYSYLLFGSEPADDAAREKYLAALISISSLPPTREMRRTFSREALNITYVPLTSGVEIKSRPTDRKAALAMLAAYNYPRARFLIDKVDPKLRGGPYIISVLKPLSSADQTPDRFLLQDLSSVTPRVINSWVTIFQSEAANEDFWEPQTARRFAADLRSVIDTVAHQIMPNMPPKIASWIGWQDVQTGKEP